jgi:hypothetical protein
MVLKIQEGRKADDVTQARFKLASIKISKPPRSGLVQHGLYRKLYKSLLPDKSNTIVLRPYRFSIH